ncbi:MAG: hypothetical protein AB7G11_02535 [Phycisphaerales bacterium]
MSARDREPPFFGFCWDCGRRLQEPERHFRKCYGCAVRQDDETLIGSAGPFRHGVGGGRWLSRRFDGKTRS